MTARKPHVLIKLAFNGAGPEGSLQNRIEQLQSQLQNVRLFYVHSSTFIAISSRASLHKTAFELVGTERINTEKTKQKTGHVL